MNEEIPPPPERFSFRTLAIGLLTGLGSLVYPPLPTVTALISNYVLHPDEPRCYSPGDLIGLGALDTMRSIMYANILSHVIKSYPEAPDPATLILAASFFILSRVENSVISNRNQFTDH